MKSKNRYINKKKKHTRRHKKGLTSLRKSNYKRFTRKIVRKSGGSSVIFTNWEDYYQALKLYCTSPDYNVEYPNYAEIHDEKGINGDIEIIQTILQNYHGDPQEGLDMLFQTMVDGGFRYSRDIINSRKFSDILRLFIDRGAVPNIDILLRSQPEYGHTYFEEEVSSYAARAALLKRLETEELVPDLVSQLNEKVHWDSIEPVSSNELNVRYSNENLFDTDRLRYLKFEFNKLAEYN
jgi:hypothetical protein